MAKGKKTVNTPVVSKAIEEKQTTGQVPVSEEDTHEKIRARAHKIWEQAGRPEGQHAEHWEQAQREIENGSGIIEGDDLPNLAAMREAVRQHSDTFLVKTDMEDADQREAAPGTREQP